MFANASPKLIPPPCSRLQSHNLAQIQSTIKKVGDAAEQIAEQTSTVMRGYLKADSYFAKPLSETELRECLRNRPELWEFDAQKLPHAI